MFASSLPDLTVRLVMSNAAMNFNVSVCNLLRDGFSYFDLGGGIFGGGGCFFIKIDTVAFK